MSCNCNYNVNTIDYGAEFKVNVSMESIDGYHMGDIDFQCTFFTPGFDGMVLDKSDMVEIDADNYVAPLSSTEIGRGMLMVKYECDVPDNDFGDSLRHEVITVNTGLTIK